MDEDTRVNDALREYRLHAVRAELDRDPALLREWWLRPESDRRRVDQGANSALVLVTDERATVVAAKHS
jgi:hypothetical protein